MQDVTVALDKIQRSWRLTRVLCALLVTSVIGAGALTENSRSRLAEKREVVSHGLLVKIHMLDAETGQRGFLLSGRAIYLRPYYAALTQLPKSRATLSDALSKEPSAAGLVNALDKAIAADLLDLDRTVNLKSAGRSEDATKLILTESGKEMMDSVRNTLQALDDSENLRMNRSEVEYTSEIRNNFETFAGSFLFNLILLVGLVLRIRHSTTQSLASRPVVAGRIDELSHLLKSANSRDDQIRGLSELSSFLQSCTGLDEAVLLLKQQLPLLMRAESGALYLMAASRDRLRQAFAWGTEPYIEYFDPVDCWAVRLGHSYRQPAQTGASACIHLRSENLLIRKDIHCLPLVAHGELMGLLVLDAGIASGEKANVENEGYRRITLEQVGLSIGNLKLRESLHQQSIRDVLTGLYNRRFLEESAQREVLRALRLQTEGAHNGMALMMIDIDHFKRFNDEHGHKVGDQVLREVAEALQLHARGSDIVARYGGEEFTIVLPDISAALAIQRAEQVRADVEKLVLQALGGNLGTVTISVGLAQLPTHGNTVEALILASDNALYEAKRAGRNRVVVASYA